MGPLAAGFASALYSSLNESWRTIIFTISTAGIMRLLLLLTLNPTSSRSTSERSLSQNLSSVLKTKETWVLGYDQLLRFGVVASFSTWIPTFVTQAHSFSTVEAGLILRASWTLAIVSIPIGRMLAAKKSQQVLGDRIGGSLLGSSCTITWVCFELLRLVVNHSFIRCSDELSLCAVVCDTSRSSWE